MAGFGTVTAPQARQSPIGSTLRESGVDATSGRGASTQAAMVPRPNQHRRPRGSLVCLRNDRSTPATRELTRLLAAGENFPFVADEKVTARRPRTGRGG